MYSKARSHLVCCEAWTLYQGAMLKAMADQGTKAHRALRSGSLEHWSPPFSRQQSSFGRDTTLVPSSSRQQSSFGRGTTLVPSFQQTAVQLWQGYKLDRQQSSLGRGTSSVASTTCSPAQKWAPAP